MKKRENHGIMLAIPLLHIAFNLIAKYLERNKIIQDFIGSDAFYSAIALFIISYLIYGIKYIYKSDDMGLLQQIIQILGIILLCVGNIIFNDSVILSPSAKSIITLSQSIGLIFHIYLIFRIRSKSK